MGMDNCVQARYTTSMSARSAMVYLRALREKNGWSRPDLERQVGLPPKQLYRWEQEGKTFPDAAEFGKWAHAVHASFAHLGALLSEDDISDAAAQAMADDRWEELHDPNNVGVQEAIDLIARLRARPVLLGRWIEYGERLLDGVGDSR